MRISTQIPIAVHCMLWIACFSQHKAISKVLAESTGSNAAIIRNIFRIAESSRAIHYKIRKGKTILSRPDEEISL